VQPGDAIGRWHRDVECLLGWPGVGRPWAARHPGSEPGLL